MSCLVLSCLVLSCLVLVLQGKGAMGCGNSDALSAPPEVNAAGHPIKAANYWRFVD
eukprot:COSAG06_NODE_42230_length_383_cov_2.795775_1_plen_55_part_10